MSPPTNNQTTGDKYFSCGILKYQHLFLQIYSQKFLNYLVFQVINIERT